MTQISYIKNRMVTRALTTNHGELKRKMLEASIKKHQTVIDDFKLSIKEMMGSEGIVNEEDLDVTQQEFNTEMVQNSDRLAEQLNFANEEMKLLRDMAPTIESIHNTIQRGCVVVTDKEIFFVSVSIERFQVDGIKVLGLSTESPLFKIMSGKKKGDRFSYKNKSYKILDVF